MVAQEVAGVVRCCWMNWRIWIERIADWWELRGENAGIVGVLAS